MFTTEKRKKGKWKCYVENQEVISQSKFCLARKCLFFFLFFVLRQHDAHFFFKKGKKEVRAAPE